MAAVLAVRLATEGRQVAVEVYRKRQVFVQRHPCKVSMVRLVRLLMVVVVAVLAKQETPTVLRQAVTVYLQALQVRRLLVAVAVAAVRLVRLVTVVAVQAVEQVLAVSV
jgi:hypothetical protein